MMDRRTLLGSAAFVPLTALIASAQPVKRGLTAGQRKTLDAFVDRLIPTDELGPGALVARVPEYIDRCLGDYLAGERRAIADGLDAVEAFAKSSEGGAFATLSMDKRDAVVAAFEANLVAAFPNGRNFFNRVRRLTLEGMFGDPHWGGNGNFVGWDLIRYPGPRLAVGHENQKLGVEIAPYRKSAWGEGHGGH
jgi:gluconate 2-dehydrogenase gamma chain